LANRRGYRINVQNDCVYIVKLMLTRISLRPNCVHYRLIHNILNTFISPVRQHKHTRNARVKIKM